MSEHDEQVALFNWAKMNDSRLPELGLLFAIPNGGQRHILVAKKMKAEGVKAGVPDIFLPVVRGHFHGMFIEMKFGKNKLTKSQKAWAEKLIKADYEFITCWGWENAAEAIEYYLAL